MINIVSVSRLVILHFQPCYVTTKKPNSQKILLSFKLEYEQKMY
jgi:hypothetical protein